MKSKLNRIKHQISSFYFLLHGFVYITMILRASSEVCMALVVLTNKHVIKTYNVHSIMPKALKFQGINGY